MPIVTLNALIGKIRRLTGSSDITQLPDDAPTPTLLNPYPVGLKDYINSFYLYDLPAQFRSLKLKDKYTFNTIQGIDTYAFNSEQFTTVEMPCYCAKREIKLFEDPWSFYGVNFNWQQQQNFTTSNGSAGPYTGTCQATPLIRSVNNVPSNITGTANDPGVSQGYSGYPSSRVQNILITANTATGTLNVTDDGNGNLIGDIGVGVNTIDYISGAINVTFSATVPAGNSIQIQYNPVVLNIPLSILFFQNQFTLRPVPDKGYTIELVAYRQPTQALLSTANQAGTPELSEWWEMIAFGAAKKIYEDRLDPDGAALMDKGLQEKYQLAYTRTYAQLGKQRISTIFSDQLSGNYGGNGFGVGGGIV